MNADARRWTWAAALLATLAVAPLLCTNHARADEDSPALAKYQKPVDEAIDKALAHLARTQLKDGSWPGPMPRNAGIASLAVMAFLAKGHAPGLAPYGDVINKGIDFVLDSQEQNGMLVGEHRSHGPMYSHAIATLLLSEASGMVSPERQTKLDAALGNALRVLLSAQAVRKDRRQQGGWRYQHNSSDSDISCTGWALMSLRSARNSGAAIPLEAIEGAVQFVLNCRSPDGGFAYQPGGGSGLARTGTALLCLELCGQHRTDATKKAGDWILDQIRRKRQGDRPRRPDEPFFYYGMYYCAQGMFQLGDEHWEQFGATLYDLLLQMQKDDGSWPDAGGNEGQGGPAYSTAMAVLAMSVAYRQLPIYQR